MSWICRNCETENPDTMDVCEVCDTFAEKSNVPNLPIDLNARYYIWGRNRSISGKDLMVTRLSQGTLVRKMLTDEWIPIQELSIPKHKTSPNSYYYVWGIKGAYKIDQIKAMKRPEPLLIREMLTDVWFTPES